MDCGFQIIQAWHMKPSQFPDVKDNSFKPDSNVSRSLIIKKQIFMKFKFIHEKNVDVSPNTLALCEHHKRLITFILYFHDKPLFFLLIIYF